MKPRLFNQERKMRLINQKLYKKAKLDFKKIRIQQQTPPSINININTGFETNRRIKDIYKRLELITPQEISPEPIEDMRARADMERIRARDLAQEQIDLAREEFENDIAVIEEEKQIRKERQMELKQQIEQNVKEAKQREKEEELDDIEFEKEMMGKEDVNILTPRELRLQSALKREKLLNQAKEKDIRDVRLQRALNKYEEAVEKTKKIKEKNLFLFG